MNSFFVYLSLLYFRSSCEARYIENREGEFDEEEFETEKGVLKASALDLLRQYCVEPMDED